MASETQMSSSMTVENTLSAAGCVFEQILLKMEDKGFSKDDIFAIHLAFTEAFSNAVRHGNKMDPTKEVKVGFSVDMDKIEISITDQGNGFEPQAIPDPRFGKNLYKPAGRGLLLMRSYMDEIEFSEQGNSVYMVRYKEKPPISKKQKRAEQ